MRIAFIAMALVAAAPLAQADGNGDHPAIVARRVIASQGHGHASAFPSFLVGHPASPTWQLRHANHDHPAIAMRREAGRLDPNTFIVQPPAHVEWKNPGAAGRQAAVAAAPVR